MAWLIRDWRPLLGLLLILLCAGMAKTASHYHDKYAAAQKQADERQETINDMQRRQKSVAALDAKYTKELADAKATINQLHDDVAAGRRRLQLNATCTVQHSTTSGSADAASPQLTPDAERAYWRLREQLATADKQINGLQQYIKEQCLK